MSTANLTEDFVEGLSTQDAQEEFYDLSFIGGGSFGVRVSNRGRKSFFLIYSLHGKRKRLTLGSYPLVSLDEARKGALRLLREVRDGLDPRAQKRRFLLEPTLSNLVKNYLESVESGGAKRKTVLDYRSVLDREVLKLWGDRKLRDIKEDEFVRLLEDLSNNRNKLVQANRLRSVLRGLSVYALEQGVIDRPLSFGVSKRTTEQAEWRILREVELKALWKILSAKRDRAASALKLVLLTGQSLKDVLSMRWSDIRVNYWDVGPKTADGISRDTKEIALVPSAMEVLKEHSRNDNRCEYVFSLPSGGCQKNIYHSIRDLQKIVKLETTWSPRNLRQTVEHGLRVMEVSPFVVDWLMGRKTRGRFLQIEESRCRMLAEQALVRWSLKLLDTGGRGKPAPSSDKVVPLFRKR